jgi:hypothetical protein
MLSQKRPLFPQPLLLRENGRLLETILPPFLVSADKQDFFPYPLPVSPVNRHTRPALVLIIQGYRYFGHVENGWLSTSEKEAFYE